MVAKGEGTTFVYPGPHPEERALARVSKDGRESALCVHPSRRLLRKLLRMRSEIYSQPRSPGRLAEKHRTTKHQILPVTSFCIRLAISTSRRQACSRNDIMRSMSRSLGSGISILRSHSATFGSGFFS